MTSNNDIEIVYCEDRHVMHENDEDFPERVSGNEMDEQRKQQMAYQYLCHLEEAKKWMEACLNDELPQTTELEEALRTGVILGKLGNFFASDVVPLRKIYDRELKKFQARGLHFKHTDNFMYFVRAMEKVGLPKLFYPETTDLYDKKNMPKVIYCIHALSLYLFKLGLAPQMQDLYGKVKFTEEEISAMRKELEKYGIQMPAFSKIGGILESEMPVDEAALHAAIIVINDAIDHGNAKETYHALSNVNAHLTDLKEANHQDYQDLLYKAKGSKCQTSLLKSPGSEDVYDKMLTQAEVQGNIAMVNEVVRKRGVDSAVLAINEAIDSGDQERLVKALMNDKARLSKVIGENGDWYQQTLSEAKQTKKSNLTHSEIQEGIGNANNIGEQYKVLESIMKYLNKALEDGNVEECHSLLRKPEALLPTVLNRSSFLYFNELNKEKKKKQQKGHSGNLTHGEITEHVQVLTATASVNQAIEQGNASDLLDCLKQRLARLKNIEDDSINRYLEQLVAVKKEKAQDCGAEKDDLNQLELQLCIDYVNTEVTEEHALITAVQAINRTIEDDNAFATLSSLQQPSAKLSNVLPENALLYQAVLHAEKQEKKKKMDDPSAELWHDEIQRCIDKCNLYALDAYKLSAGVAKINASLNSGTEQSTIEALENADVALRGVTRECQSSYYTSLKETKQNKGKEAGPWLEQRIPQGYLFYYNTATQQSSWAKPVDFTENAGLLTKEEIQAVVARETAKHGRQVYLQANEPQIIALQSHWRGYLARKSFNERKEFFTKKLPAIIKIQANVKRWIHCSKYKNRLEVLHSNEDAVVKIQAGARMHLARSRYLKRKKLYEDNLPAIIKLQAFTRAHLAQHDYRALLSLQDPPLKIVRKFLHLLDQSDLDFEEELELQKLKAQVVTEIRSNQQLESDLHTMDIKIGLLVRNKITLQDVVIHNKKITRKDKDKEGLASKNTKGIKSLSKESQEKLEAYQHLFYLLQTNPVYLAKLIFEMPQSRSTNFMESVILTLYNYASNAREEYLLLKLFETALREEIFSKIDSIQEIVTGNPTVIKMVVGFNRGTRNQTSLRELLQPLVQTVLDDTTLNTTVNPVEIYKNWINQMESDTGEASKRPYDVQPHEAMQHPEVKSKVEAAMGRLTAATDRFLDSITESVDKIPYGIRYLAMTLRTCLAEKFPSAGKEEILRVVGNLIYYRYMNPAIVAPDAFDIVDVKVEKGLSVEQRRNLGSISKLLQDAASNKKFGSESAHLNSLNPYLEKAHQKFLKFFTAASNVEEPEAKFNIDEYSDVTMVTKPTIYISIQEICDTHKLLLDHRHAIAPDESDPLQELLDDVGNKTDVKELIGRVAVADGQTEEDVLREQAKSEISLTLSNKFEVPDDDDSDIRALFVRTKHLIVDVIRVQAGDTLTEILETPATEEQEREHMNFVKQREKQDSKTESNMRKSTSLYGDSNLPIEGIKRKIIRNLRVLENQGHVTTKNNYQDIVNAIARDIRNQRRYRMRRSQELRKLVTTLERLKAKATFHEEQMDYYNRYVETCLDNLAGKEQMSQKKEKKKQDDVFRTAVKYSAQKLAEKGVVLEIEGLPKNQLKNASFEIMPSNSGVFVVSAKFMGIQMEKVDIVFQDLLQLQFEGVAVMKMFGKAKVNVNLLIHLLNKKFYGKT